MITEILILLAEEVEKEVCLKIENDELKTGNKLSHEYRDELYCQKVISKFEKFITRLRKAGCSEQDIYNVLQMAEANSEENEWFAGLHFGHSPNGDEKFDYYANHTQRPKIFEEKFKAAISRLFQQPELVEAN
jgi:hypothetical protein